MEQQELVKLSDKQRELIEKLGVIMEKTGWSPASSRVHALLTVADRFELTFDEIREALNLSKSATSNALSFLQRLSVVEYITKPGDRKRYFRITADRVMDHLRERLKNIEELHQVLKEVIQQRTTKTVEYNEQLREDYSFCEFFVQKCKKIFQEWEKKKS
ncbi:GbsR/MarR family transcriptional regulator [Xanthovirga aplysinae]|uniref:GbsR/MarR family transcriptional regulator n=1 Tax=Xanthovirga aplysinae TaxID=2529853 RepID=UPI0012BBC12D|nr:MarR family transcriptional regulator [Xanthovirga aplysinae]MTI32725.1 MarR family transcriptional regulator [Xanthovirga aplysinae]